MTRLRPRGVLSAGCTIGACLLALACGQSNKPTTARLPAAEAPVGVRTPDPVSAADGPVQAHGAAAAAGSSGATPLQRPVCPLITVAEMAAILDAPVGKPAEDDSPGKTSCSYPPADAGSWAQAEVAIEWDHGDAPSAEQQLVDAFGGSAVGQQVAHDIPLGDRASYSIEGALSIRTGRTLVTITLPMRPDSEEKAIAIGRLLLNRLGVPYAKAAANAASTTPELTRQ